MPSPNRPSEPAGEPTSSQLTSAMAPEPTNVSLSNDDLNNEAGKDNGVNIPLTDTAHDIPRIPSPIPTLGFDSKPRPVNRSTSWPHPSLNDAEPSTQNHFDSSSLAGAGPRRGSFSDFIPHGHRLPRPLSTTAPSLRGGMFSHSFGEDRAPDSAHGDAQTDSDPEFRSSGPSSRMSLAPRSDPLVDESTITVASLEHHSEDPPKNSTHTPTPSAPQVGNKQYVLSDGSVVSGKGLGRGRPGVKRGPRTSKHQTGEDASPQMTPTSAMSPPPLNYVRPSKKLKTGDSENAAMTSRASASTTSRESSEEYNPTATHTRFGRHTQKPQSLATATPIAPASASPARKLARATSTNTAASHSPASVKTHPKIKRRVYRGREQFALCEHCLRGHGPTGNVIVFCDACNKCWHQRCHDPPISKQTVSDSKADWFCVDCDRILHGGKKGKKTQTKSNPTPVAAAPVVDQKPVFAGPRVGGRLVPPDQKVVYLKTLSKEELTSLLLQASDLAPDLPLFQTLQMPVASIPQAQFTSSYVTPVSTTPVFGDADHEEGMDEGYDGFYDEHASLYPKPGNGVKLPPESEDLHMLLEGKESRTFSHWVRGMKGNAFSGTGNIPMVRP